MGDCRAGCKGRVVAWERRKGASGGQGLVPAPICFEACICHQAPVMLAQANIHSAARAIIWVDCAGPSLDAGLRQRDRQKSRAPPFRHSGLDPGFGFEDHGRDASDEATRFSRFPKPLYRVSGILRQKAGGPPAGRDASLHPFLWERHCHQAHVILAQASIHSAACANLQVDCAGRSMDAGLRQHDRQNHAPRSFVTLGLLRGQGL